jgi:hypothetical protein
MLQRMIYSKFRHITPDGDALDKAPMVPYPFVPTSNFRIITLIDEPATQVVYEDWFKGNDVEWVYWLDAFHVVISGEAEITYWNGPDWSESGTVTAKAGDMYLTPRGSRCRWHITSDEPFRHIVLDIPHGGYETADLKKG